MPRPAKRNDEGAALRRVSGRGGQRILAILDEAPMTPVQLREKLGLTRQAIQHALRKLISRGLVKRIRSTGERGHHVYMTAGADVSEALLARTPHLTEPRERVLSALQPETLYVAEDIAEFREVGVGTVRRHIRYLAAMELLVHFEVRRKVFCALTPKGAAHPQFQRSGTKAPPANVFFSLGLSGPS